MNQVERGKFISIEGIEGAGKTTHLIYLQRLLEMAGQPPLVTREPGGTALGEEIRSLLLAHRHAGMSAESELLMMFSARSENLNQRVRPALERGQWVLCDRFTDASYAYQGGGRGLDQARIQGLEDWVQQGLTPDLTLLLDLPVKLGLARAGRRSQPDRFESEQQGFFERVREAYLERALQDPGRIRVIDASPEIPEVQRQIQIAVSAFLRQSGLTGKASGSGTGG